MNAPYAAQAALADQPISHYHRDQRSVTRMTNYPWWREKVKVSTSSLVKRIKSTVLAPVVSRRGSVRPCLPTASASRTLYAYHDEHICSIGADLRDGGTIWEQSHVMLGRSIRPKTMHREVDRGRADDGRALGNYRGPMRHMIHHRRNRYGDNRPNCRRTMEATTALVPRARMSREAMKGHPIVEEKTGKDRTFDSQRDVDDIGKKRKPGKEPDEREVEEGNGTTNGKKHRKAEGLTDRCAAAYNWRGQSCSQPFPLPGSPERCGYHRLGCCCPQHHAIGRTGLLQSRGSVTE